MESKTSNAIEKSLMKRYELAIKELGGALALLNLPEEDKNALKKAHSLSSKVFILESIVREMGIYGNNEDEFEQEEIRIPPVDSIEADHENRKVYITVNTEGISVQDLCDFHDKVSSSVSNLFPGYQMVLGIKDISLYIYPV